MIYLSSTTAIPDEYKWEKFGIIFSAKKTIGGYMDALNDGAPWVMDNDAFSGKFDQSIWEAALERYVEYAASCVAIPSPDVLGDAKGTLRNFDKYLPLVSKYPYPVTIVTQDGMTPADIPWQAIDVLFVGGTDNHKLGDEAATLINVAKGLGKWVHVGRVNSAKRIRMFRECDSVDGTSLSYRAGKERQRQACLYANAMMEIERSSPWFT